VQKEAFFIFGSGAGPLGIKKAVFCGLGRGGAACVPKKKMELCPTFYITRGELPDG